jgi:hypothetical protein
VFFIKKQQRWQKAQVFYSNAVKYLMKQTFFAVIFVATSDQEHRWGFFYRCRGNCFISCIVSAAIIARLFCSKL